MWGRARGGGLVSAKDRKARVEGTRNSRRWQFSPNRFSRSSSPHRNEICVGLVYLFLSFKGIVNLQISTIVLQWTKVCPQYRIYLKKCIMDVIFGWVSREKSANTGDSSALCDIRVPRYNALFSRTVFCLFPCSFFLAKGSAFDVNACTVCFHTQSKQQTWHAHFHNNIISTFEIVFPSKHSPSGVYLIYSPIV